MRNIIIFASGKGSNAKNIIDYFKGTDIKVSLIVSDNPTAGVLDIAAQELIPTTIINKEALNTTEFIDYLKSFEPELIVLAGFLKLIPVNMVKKFKMVNIHPSLLPKYGGKGMYGENIHKAVIDAKETKSGVTIHYVNENYDEGKIILQVTCKIKETDTAEDLQEKIHHIEHLYYPEVINTILDGYLDILDIDYDDCKEKYIKFDSLNWEKSEETRTYSTEIECNAKQVLQITIRESKQAYKRYIIDFIYNKTNKNIKMELPFCNVPKTTPLNDCWIIIEF